MGPAKHGAAPAHCKDEPGDANNVKVVTTFSGRSDVDASELVKTQKTKKILEQLKRSKNAIIHHKR